MTSQSPFSQTMDFSETMGFTQAMNHIDNMTFQDSMSCSQNACHSEVTECNQSMNYSQNRECSPVKSFSEKSEPYSQSVSLLGNINNTSGREQSQAGQDKAPSDYWSQSDSQEDSASSYISKPLLFRYRPHLANHLSNKGAARLKMANQFHDLQKPEKRESYREVMDTFGKLLKECSAEIKTDLATVREDVSAELKTSLQQINQNDDKSETVITSIEACVKEQVGNLIEQVIQESTLKEQIAQRDSELREKEAKIKALEETINLMKEAAEKNDSREEFHLQKQTGLLEDVKFSQEQFLNMLQSILKAVDSTQKCVENNGVTQRECNRQLDTVASEQSKILTSVTLIQQENQETQKLVSQFNNSQVGNHMVSSSSTAIPNKIVAPLVQGQIIGSKREVSLPFSPVAQFSKNNVGLVMSKPSPTAVVAPTPRIPPLKAPASRVVNKIEMTTPVATPVAPAPKSPDFFFGTQTTSSPDDLDAADAFDIILNNQQQRRNNDNAKKVKVAPRRADNHKTTPLQRTIRSFAKVQKRAKMRSPALSVKSDNVTTSMKREIPKTLNDYWTPDSLKITPANKMPTKTARMETSQKRKLLAEKLFSFHEDPHAAKDIAALLQRHHQNSKRKMST